MVYIVVIKQEGETAILHCTTLEEAQRVRTSFINYGKCESVTIETEGEA